jgi:hypothetical protein
MALLAGEAAAGGRLRLQASERNFLAAVEAQAVSAVFKALQGGLERAQLHEVARELGLAGVGNEVGEGLIADVGRRACDAGIRLRHGQCASRLRLMNKNYPSLVESSDPERERGWAFVRIVPQVISIIDYTRGFGHSLLVKL